MIGFDTNVMLRIIVKDDPAQTAIALALLDRTEAAGESIFLSDMVLCELAWTLRAAYKKPDREIAAVFRALADTDDLRFESPERLDKTIKSYGRGHGDFSDYFIRERAIEAGCRKVITFDKALLREPGFIEPEGYKP